MANSVNSQLIPSQIARFTLEMNASEVFTSSCDDRKICLAIRTRRQIDKPIRSNPDLDRRKFCDVNDPSLYRLATETGMEKFTKFRDPGTGIAPFLPIASGSRTPIYFPFELMLCIIRFTLIFLVFGLEVILVDILGELTLRKVAPRVLAWIRWLFMRTILLLCGIWVIEEILDGVSKSYRLLEIKADPQIQEIGHTSSKSVLIG